MGVPHIESVLKHKPINSTHLTFVFPEAHMSVHEEQRFMYELNKHPEADKIEQVDILTKSPFFKTNCKVFSVPFTRHPIALSPILVCTAYAKSIGVAFIGNLITAPLGEKQKTFS